MDPLNPDIAQLLSLLGQGAASKNYGLVAVAALIGTVYLVRKFLVPRLPDGKAKAFLSSSSGGWVLNAVASVAGALATSLIAGAPVTVSVILAAVVTALAGAGAVEAVKDFAPAKKAGQDAAKSPADTLNS